MAQYSTLSMSHPQSHLYEFHMKAKQFLRRAHHNSMYSHISIDSPPVVLAC